MAEEPVDIIVRLSNLQTFVSQAREAGEGVKRIGTLAKEGAASAAESTRKVSGVVGLIGRAARSSVTELAGMGRSITREEGVVNRSIRRMKEATGKPILGGGMGSMLLGGLAAGFSVEGIKSAVDNTKELAVNAESLHRVTGMSTQDAATWQAVTQAYGVNARGFAMSMRSLSSNVFQAGMKSKQSLEIFKSMGISMADIKSHGHDMNGMLNLVIDRFDKMPAGVNKTAVATRLFGRNWQALMPLFSAGSKAIEEQRKEAAAYGVQLGGSSTENAMKLHEAQVQLQLATTGLQVTFAEHLAPTLVKVFGHVLQLYGVVRSQMTPAFNTAGSVVRSVSTFFREHRTLLLLVKDALGLLVAMWVLGRVQIIAARIAMLALNGVAVISKVIMIGWRIALIAWRVAMVAGTAAVWLFNAALDANPIALAIIALVAIGVALYHFRRQVGDVIKFVIAHWRLFILILGPVGLAIDFVTAHIKTFRAVANAVFHFVVGAVKWMVGAIRTVVKVLYQVLSAPFRWAWENVIKPVANWIVGAVRWMVGIVSKAFAKISGPIKTVVGAVGSVIGGAGSVAGKVGHFLGLGQHGLHATQRGYALVGEAGPELVELPGGATVHPMATAGVSTVSAGDFAPTITTIVQIDKKEIARAVGSFTSDRLARR